MLSSGSYYSSTTKTTGTSQSLLAKKAAPPEKRPFWGAFLTAFIGLFFLDGGIGAYLFGLALIAASGYWVFYAVQFNLKEWPKQHQYWLESWICHKCGNIYHQAEKLGL
jgi:hypothetical protein